jgi:predicted porin
MVWSRWRVPLATTTPAGIDLDALAVWVEGRYRFTPRISAGLRVDHLGFSDVGTGAARLGWDAPVDRVEAAIGYALQRNLTARIGVQRNHRDAGRIHTRTFLSAQLAYWF